MIAKTIKNMLCTRQVFEHYGYKVNNKGFINCPFHKDKDASMKVYDHDRGYNCYGCGENGSVIDFVMKIYSLTLQQAITRLNYDFRLGLTSEKPTARELKEAERRRKEKETYRYCKKLIDEYKDIEVRKYWRQFHNNKPSKPFEELSNEFIDAMMKLNQFEMIGGGYNF